MGTSKRISRRDFCQVGAAAAATTAFPLPAFAQSAPRVVVIGGGFGGASCARALKQIDPKLQVALVEQSKTFTACPFSNNVIAGLRGIEQQQFGYDKIVAGGVTVAVQAATAVDAAARTVRLADGTSLSYDRLVLAAGSTYSYFGHDEWAAMAPAPKTIADALRIRARILSAFERAENSGDAAEQAMLLTFVIVGGGATGVEMAGAIADLVRYITKRDFRRIDADMVREASRGLPRPHYYIAGTPGYMRGHAPDAGRHGPRR